MDKTPFRLLKENEIGLTEPAEDWTAGMVRAWMANHCSDSDIAAITAISSNQHLWLLTLYKTNDKRYRECGHEDWWALRTEMVYSIMRLIEPNDERRKIFRESSFEKKMEFIEPFMNKYSFYLKDGWWFYNCDKN